MSTGSVVVYSTASYPPHPTAMLYTVVAGALAFAAHLTGSPRAPIEIRLLPLSPRESRAGLLGWARRQARRLRGRGPELPEGAFGTRAVAGDPYRLRTAQAEIAIVPWGGGWLAYLRALASAARLWRTCFRGSGFEARRFIALEHRGVLIGDLAASEHLRWDFEAAGRLRPERALFLMLADCVFICDTCFERVKAPDEAAVLVLEPTYRHAVYKRALHRRGATVIDVDWYAASRFVFTPAGEEIPNSFRIGPPRGSADPAGSEAVHRYMAGRLERPLEYLWYLRSGWNDNRRAQVRDENGQPVEIPADGLAVVIFLHSFDDNQYMYGSDGFGDLFEWTQATLRACLANPRIARVMVKPHPACADPNFPSTLAGLALLRREFPADGRLVWLERDTSLRAIAQLPCVVAITHHGSVAEEMVYLDVPVVAYRHASWGDGYGFVRGWSTPDEYLGMLAQLSRESHARPTGAERASLLAFVKECRFRAGGGEWDFSHEYRRFLEAQGRSREAARDDSEVSAEMGMLGEEAALRFVDFLAQRAGGGFEGSGRLAAR